MTSPPSVTSLIVYRLHAAPADQTLSLIFPGQGSQKVGMAADLCRTYRSAREVFEQAEGVLGLELKRLCFEGPDEELRQTANAQPAIMVASLACLAVALEAGAISRRPAFLAGHSLGEYTALVAAGCLTFEDALRLVRERGRLMQEAGEWRPGTMAAVLGLSEDEAAAVCRLAGAEVCNYNSPTQVVVGGTPEAVARVAALAKERGGKAMPLNVSGAFHTSLMAKAAREFASIVDRTSTAEPAIPVVANVTAHPMTSAEEVRTELKEQMLRPVLWRQSVTAMVQGGVVTFVEVGPGRVLSGLVSRTAPGARTASVDGAASLPSLSNV